MNLKICRFLFVALFCYGNLGFAQLIKVESFAPKRVDSIRLERNWRTKDPIILAELDFTPGDTVTPENLATSLKKVWNLQNFATVDYRWDSLPDGRSILVLTTRDALTVRPIIAGHTDINQDVTLKLGAADHNFLGRNIALEVRAQASVHDPVLGEAKITIPRQLLWKNMSIGGGFELSEVLDERYNRYYLQVVNPFHEDFHNTFAPDLETGWLKNYSRPPHICGYDSIPDWYRQHTYNFWYVRLSESIGLITHRRHQEEGYLITGMLGASAGLNSESNNYWEGSLKAEFHKMLNQRLQFSATWDGYYCSSEFSSMWTRFGPSDIRGIHYSELSGQAMHLASTGLYYTWMNRDRLAIEQSIFVQYAAAMESFSDRKSVTRHYAIGTGFQFTIPMFPAASILIAVSYNPNRSNWYYLEL